MDLLDHFLAREPALEARIEVAIAHLTTMFAAVHTEKGAPKPEIIDFLPYLKAWPEEKQGGRYNEIDREIMKVML